MPIMNPTKYPPTWSPVDARTATTPDDVGVMAAINSTALMELTTSLASALLATSGGGAAADASADDSNRTGASMLAASAHNVSFDDAKRDFVFDRTDVRAIYITLYTMVFCCCFFGKARTHYIYYIACIAPFRWKTQIMRRSRITCSNKFSRFSIVADISHIYMLYTYIYIVHIGYVQIY